MHLCFSNKVELFMEKLFFASLLFGDSTRRILIFMGDSFFFLFFFFIDDFSEIFYWILYIYIFFYYFMNCIAIVLHRRSCNMFCKPTHYSKNIEIDDCQSRHLLLHPTVEL